MTDADVPDRADILVLAVFVGFEVIWRVPSLLHTPLMSGTNAIPGIVLVGAIVVAGPAAGTLTRLGRRRGRRRHHQRRRRVPRHRSHARDVPEETG